MEKGCLEKQPSKEALGIWCIFNLPFIMFKLFLLNKIIPWKNCTFFPRKFHFLVSITQFTGEAKKKNLQFKLPVIRIEINDLVNTDKSLARGIKTPTDNLFLNISQKITTLFSRVF